MGWLSRWFGSDESPMKSGDSVRTLRKGVADAQWGGSVFPSGSTGSHKTESVPFAGFRSRARDMTPKELYALTVAVNSCNNAIVRNVSQARVRIFSRDGREVVGGRLYNLIKSPSPRNSWRSFVSSLVTWWNVLGEMAVYLAPGEDGYPGKMLDLDPSCLYVDKPTSPRRAEDVVTWRYLWPDGTQEVVRADWMLFERMWNPLHPVRGLSPLVTGSTVASVGQGAWTYNKDFFVNGGIPSHMVVLGEGVGRSQREDFEERYRNQFSNYNGNSHKVMVVSGKTVRIEKLSDQNTTGWFLELFEKVDEAVARLYRVPAIEAFLFSKTRFDTATEERKLFLQSTIQPLCDLVSDVLQYQLVDRHFQFDDLVEYGDTGLSRRRNLSDRFDRARSERQESNFIVLLDTDTMPVMAEIKSGMIAAAKAFRETADASANEALDYFGIELPYRPERDEIWVDRNKICLSNPELNGRIFGSEMLALQRINAVSDNATSPKESSGDSESGKPGDGSKSAISKRRVKRHLGRIYGMIRSSGTLDLEEADRIAGGDFFLKKLNRLLRYQLSKSDPIDGSGSELEPSADSASERHPPVDSDGKNG